MHPHMFNLLRNRACFAPDGGGEGGGAGGGSAPPPPNPPPPEKETFSKEYVAELRAEAKGYRLRSAELEAKLRAADDDKTKLGTEAEAKITEAKKAADTRIIMAEVKVAAIKAGMVDLDGLKLADMSKVALKDDGTVEGVDDLIKAFKEAKPYFFGTGNTDGTGKPPPKDPPGTKKATEMTDAEYQEAKRKLTGRR